MTANTPTAVTSTQNFDEEGYFSEIAQQNVVVAAQDEIIASDEGKNDADALLDRVRDEGMEEALISLGEDEPETEEGMATSDNNTQDEEEEVLEETRDKPKTEEEDIEKIMVLERINELEAKVVDLEGKNQQLAEQLKSTNENLQLSLEVLQQMAVLLRRIIEKEEDEKEKVSLLEIFVAMMGNLLESLAKPEEENYGYNQTVARKKPVKRTGSNITEYDEFLRKMLERQDKGADVAPISKVA